MTLNQSQRTPRPSKPWSAQRCVGNALTLVLAPLFLWFGPFVDQAAAADYTVTCGGSKTIAASLEKLKPGDTLVVSGTCNENVVVTADLERITLDGGGTATINGGSSTKPNTVTVAAKDVTIRGFTITGGGHGVSVQDGGFAVIDANTIQSVGKNGIVVFRNSTARITNNTIQNNPSGGINVGHTSSALIGFTGPPGDRESEPNVIQSNGGPGIQVVRGSSAQIFSNIIQNNVSHGVLVDRNSQAEVAACSITGNGGDGIQVRRNSGADIGTNLTASFDDDTNTGSNGAYGVHCMTDGFVDGLQGTLTGTLGGQSFDEDCVDSVAP